MELTVAKAASLARTGFDGIGVWERVPLGCACVDATLKGGLQAGALHEVFAQGGHEAAATGFALALALRLSRSKRLLWVRQDFSALEQGELAATGLLEMGVDPARVVVFCAAHVEDALTTGRDALSSPALGAVVIEIAGQSRLLDLVASRRLTLAARASGVSACLLRFGAEPQTSSAETRWRVKAAASRADDDWGHPRFEIDLVRNRHGSTGHWVMEWNGDEGVFAQQRPPDRGLMVRAASDRPVAAEIESAGSLGDGLLRFAV